jgi:hypothetical protein
MKTYKIENYTVEHPSAGVINKQKIIYYTDGDVDFEEFFSGEIRSDYKNEHGNKEVELWKVKGVLTIMGLTSQVDTALENLSEPTKTLAKLSWQNGNVLHSRSETVKFVQNVLQLTDEQVDSIFDQANAIKL